MGLANSGNSPKQDQLSFKLTSGLIKPAKLFSPAASSERTRCGYPLSGMSGTHKLWTHCSIIFHYSFQNKHSISTPFISLTLPLSWDQRLQFSHSLKDTRRSSAAGTNIKSSRAVYLPGSSPNWLDGYRSCNVSE
jgi:hypothetical protein